MSALAVDLAVFAIAGLYVLAYCAKAWRNRGKPDNDRVTSATLVVAGEQLPERPSASSEHTVVPTEHGVSDMTCGTCSGSGLCQHCKGKVNIRIMGLPAQCDRCHKTGKCQSCGGKG